MRCRCREELEGRPAFDVEAGLSHLPVHRHKRKILPTSRGEISSGHRAHARSAVECANAHPRRDFHGPQIANVIPGSWTFTNSVLPSGEKHAPANSRLRGCALRAMR